MASEKLRYLKRHERKRTWTDQSEQTARLVEILKEEPVQTLTHLLATAYQTMNAEQRSLVFDKLLQKARLRSLDGKELVEKIRTFAEQSRAGEYFAPFDIDSKNFRNIPEETNEWFYRLGEFLKDASQLAHREDYENAVTAFELLYELIDAMESGDEIVFADECGSWMIPVKEEECVAAYLKAVSKIENEFGFANTAADLISRDSTQSFSLKAYESAKQVASSSQMHALEERIKRRGIRTS